MALVPVGALRLTTALGLAVSKVRPWLYAVIQELLQEMLKYG